MAQKLIEVHDLKKYYNGGDVKALDGVTADVYKGDVIAVIGPSGGGKSTFLRSLNLLETPTSGSILFNGVDITGKKVDLPLHRQKMGMVFQHFNLFPNKTVLDNLICILFAYWTNRTWVFTSRTHGSAAWREFARFFGCRIGTLVMDTAIMYVGGNVLGPLLIPAAYRKLWGLGVKVFSNVVVVVLNYVFSKLFIFKKNDG